jgi:hypothetical protein
MACVIPITSQILVEWELQQALFQADRPLVDLFANNVNHELKIYVSPISGKKACAVDAIFPDLMFAKLFFLLCMTNAILVSGSTSVILYKFPFSSL